MLFNNSRVAFASSSGVPGEGGEAEKIRAANISFYYTPYLFRCMEVGEREILGAQKYG